MIHHTIESKENLNLELHDGEHHNLCFSAHTKGQLSLILSGSGNVVLDFDILENSQWHILVVHSGLGDLSIQENFTIKKDSEVHLSYGQFTKGKIKKNSQYNLVGQGASLYTKGALLIDSYFDWILQSNHLAKNTYAELNNNLVIQRDGFGSLEVIGSIPKGYSQSKTHQMSKILNLGDKAQAHVYPKLLIDENDVEASHAASVGQPEAEHIYYLMSRGLSYDQAVGLLIKGYLHPVVNEIEDETLKETLFELIDIEVQG